MGGMGSVGKGGVQIGRESQRDGVGMMQTKAVTSFA